MTDAPVPDDDPDTYHERGVYCGERAHCTPPYPDAEPGTPYDKPDPAEFARVVDELREQYRPGVPDDVVPLPDAPDLAQVPHADFGRVPHVVRVPDGWVPGPDWTYEGHVAWVAEQVAKGEQALTGVVREATGRDDLVAEYDTTPLRDNTVRVDWSVAPTSPAPQRPLYVAACSTCAAAGENIGEPPAMAAPFKTEADRDRWAAGHANERGHVVTLAEQTPETGTTITAKIDPDVDRAVDPTCSEPDHDHRTSSCRGPAAIQRYPRFAGAAAAPKPPTPPLVAFIARESGPPDLVCRIPPRAGAAWLLTAAHACMLGRGSLGIEQPHRVLYVGRLSRGTDEDPDEWLVRIDGVLGASDLTFGAPVGGLWAVSGKADIPTVEDTVEALIEDHFTLGRHLFSVILMTDAPVGLPPDEHAEQTLREERIAERARRREADEPAVDAVREFVHRTDQPWSDSEG